MAVLEYRELFLKELSGPISVSVDHPAPMLVICSNGKDILYILIAHCIHSNLLASFLPPVLLLHCSAFLGNLAWPTAASEMSMYNEYSAEIGWDVVVAKKHEL